MPDDARLEAPGRLHPPIGEDVPEPVLHRRDRLGEVGLQHVVIVGVGERGVYELVQLSQPRHDRVAGLGELQV